MKLKINGEEKTLESEALTVTELLAVEAVKMPDMVTVEVNGDILDRDQFDATTLKDGDEVEFLYFMGGGSHDFGDIA